MTILFDIGRLVATPGAIDACNTSGDNILGFVTRHAQGDWGELDKEDVAANNHALLDGSRLLSAYHLSDSTKIWIITEADRSSTCCLLPSEY